MIQGFAIWLDNDGDGQRGDLPLDAACRALAYQIPVTGQWRGFRSGRVTGRVLVEGDDGDWIRNDDGLLVFFRGRLDGVPGGWFDPGLAQTDRELNPLEESAGIDELIRGYRAHGTAVFDLVAGPFLVLIDDPERDGVMLIRDALGDRSAVYARHENGWLVASDERAMTAHHPHPNPDFLHRNLAFRPADARLTALKSVFELPPGHQVELGVTDQLTARRPLVWPKPDRASGNEHHIDALEAALKMAIGRRLDPGGKTAIALSGGMDSAPLAALAHQFYPEREVLLFSYRFESHSSVDESSFVAELADQIGAEVTWIDGDDLGPFNSPDWTDDLPCGETFIDAYRGLRRTLYHAARESGCRVLLTGDFGDHLYLGAHFWLRDLLLSRPFGNGWSRLIQRIRLQGLGAWRSDAVLRCCLPGVGWFAGRPTAVPSWCLGPRKLPVRPDNDLPRAGRVAGREAGFFSASAARLARMGHEEAGRFGLDLRFPYRDIQVMRVFAALPGWLLHDPDGEISKPVMREMMRDRMPNSIVDRVSKTTFRSLLDAAVEGPGKPQINAWLDDQDADWHRYVDPRWLARHRSDFQHDEDDFAVVWAIIALQLWLEGLAGRSRTTIGIDSQTT